MRLIEAVLNPNNFVFWIIILAPLATIAIIISRPLSTYIKFVYPNAKFEAIGNPYILENELNKLIESKDLTNFKDILNTNKDYNIAGEKALEIHESLDKNFISTVEMMKKDSSKRMKEFFDVYLEKIDIYLIKRAIKDKIKGVETDKSILRKTAFNNTKIVLQRIIDADKNEIPNILRNHGFPKELIDEISKEKDTDFLKIDNTIDRFLIEKFKKVKVPYKCEKGKNDFLGYFIDILNIKNILRAKHMGYDTEDCKKLFLGEGKEIAYWKYKELSDCESVEHVIAQLQGTSFYDPLKNAIEEYNREKSVQVLEKVLDAHFLKLIKNISLENYLTIGPTIRFLISKEYEIRNLKVIAKGIEEGLPLETIKKLLVTEVEI